MYTFGRKSGARLFVQTTLIVHVCRPGNQNLSTSYLGGKGDSGLDVSLIDELDVYTPNIAVSEKLR